MPDNRSLPEEEGAIEGSHADLSRWADAWSVAGERMDAMRRAQLANLTDAKARAIIESIFSGPAPPVVEKASGLIEQQELFRKLR